MVLPYFIAFRCCLSLRTCPGGRLAFRFGLRYAPLIAPRRHEFFRYPTISRYPCKHITHTHTNRHFLPLYTNKKTISFPTAVIHCCLTNSDSRYVQSFGLVEPTPFIRDFFLAPQPDFRPAGELSESIAEYESHLRNAELENDLEGSWANQHVEVRPYHNPEAPGLRDELARGLDHFGKSLPPHLIVC